MLHLVATHGRGAAFDIPTTEQRDWSDALHYGLQRVGAPYAHNLPIAFAYYGDLWRPDTPGGVSERGAGSVSERPTDLKMEVASELLTANNAPFARRHLGWSDLTALAVALDERTHIGEFIVRRFLRDLAQYFSDDTVRQQTVDRLAKVVRAAGDDVMLLAHSMGTIVAYDLLIRHPDMPVRVCITFGSPLGLASIRRYIRDATGAIPFPPLLERWFNLYNPDDVVAAVGRLEPFYPAEDGRHVEDIEMVGRPPNLTDMLAGHDPRIFPSSIAMGQTLRGLLEPGIGGPKPGATVIEPTETSG